MTFAVRQCALLLLCCSFVTSGNALASDEPGKRSPNFVIIFCDDLGYGDLGCYGHPTIRTPNIDRMAAEGLRFTQFYVASPACTPSRAALLTGRLPRRSGLNDVLYPASAGGLPANEITLAELLKQRGYATACIGKWHLGHRPEYLPRKHGFDYYFGLPYSNDMDRPDYKEPQIPLVHNEKVIEQPANQETLTERYTQESLAFIRQHRDQPFLLYLAHTFPHTPLHAGKEKRGQSKRGLYGDVVEEIDRSTGEILNELRESDLAENTLVIFSSDNGPWQIRKLDGGSASLLRAGKATTYEGGVREPGIFWWPGKITAGRTTAELASTLDVLPTLARLAGAELPRERRLDGYDLSTVLLESGPSPRQRLYYYYGTRFMAVRDGPWKLHVQTVEGFYKVVDRTAQPLLFHLERDPSEQYDVAPQQPEIVARLRGLAAQHQREMKPGPEQR